MLYLQRTSNQASQSGRQACWHKAFHSQGVCWHPRHGLQVCLLWILLSAPKSALYFTLTGDPSHPPTHHGATSIFDLFKHNLVSGAKSCMCVARAATVKKLEVTLVSPTMWVFTEFFVTFANWYYDRYANDDLFYRWLTTTWKLISINTALAQASTKRCCEQFKTNFACTLWTI